MFRLVNLRNHDLTDVHAVVSFARWVIDRTARAAAASTSSRSSATSIIFMPLHWVIVHPIGANSPLRGFVEPNRSRASGSGDRLPDQRRR